MIDRQDPQSLSVLKRPYSRKLTPDTESGGYLGTIHEFPGCVAYGETPQEAYENLEKAAESWLEAAEDSNFNIPEPANYESCSGRIALRISRRLHQSAAERADLEGVSLNQLISTALATYLGHAKGIETMVSDAKKRIEAINASLISLPLNIRFIRPDLHFHLNTDAYNKIIKNAGVVVTPEPYSGAENIVLDNIGHSRKELSHYGV